MINWDDLIIDAQRAGFTVWEDDGMWWITTPSRPRMPAQDLGTWGDARGAWRAAALIKSRFWGDRQSSIA